MIEFRGTYFDGKSSMPHPVSVRLVGTLLLISSEEGGLRMEVPVNRCIIEPQLGNTPRTIVLPMDARCETGDLEAVSELERALGRNPGMRFVHFLEHRWKVVALSFLGLVLSVWAFVAYGIPYAAKKIACSVPPEMVVTMSRETLEVLDERFLRDSELTEDKREETEELFRALVQDMESSYPYQLEFRKSPALGPNAFALPSGLIVMTDEMVGLAESGRELQGVLLHEIAHVENRHGLRSVIQNAGAFLLVSALVGDATAITSTAAALPTLLAQTGYSRKFEREADEFSVLYFIRKGWSTRPYRDILVRITEGMPDIPGEAYLSTHPVTAERVRHIEEIEASRSQGE